MDHFGASGDPQDMRNIARIAATDTLRMKGVIGDKPPPDLDPPLVADGDAIAALERAFNAHDSGGQQTFAMGQRGHSAGVDKHCSFELKRPADPNLPSCDWVRRGEEPGALIGFRDARDRMDDTPVSDHHVRPGRSCNAGGLDLGAHAAARELRCSGAAIASISGVIRSTTFSKRACALRSGGES